MKNHISQSNGSLEEHMNGSHSLLIPIIINYN